MGETQRRPKILVVDGDEDQRELILEALSSHYGPGSRKDIIGVGTAAECLQKNLDGFDAILQDYHLPDMDGLVLLEKLLSRADLPVIFVTRENVSSMAIKAIQQGAQDYLIKRGDYLFAVPVIVDKNVRQHRLGKENQRLQRDLETTLDEVRVANIQLEESLSELRTMAVTDHLTGLANRRHFSETLDRYYSEAVRYGYDLTCCMCDLDRYKQLNDTLGHQVGDQVLIVAAEVIHSSLRASDAAARYGGDEFVLLLPHTSVDGGQVVAERIRGELVARSRKHPSIQHPVTLSLGIASLEANEPAGADSLVSMADRALYLAKQEGRDRIVPFSRTCQVTMQE